MSPHDLDLSAYLARIGLPTAGSPSLALLRAIVARHAATIPFENLDIVLGRPIRIDLASIQAKLVYCQRGGYCFEQNTLLRAVLEELGFNVTSLMARFVRGVSADAITFRDHMLPRVDLPEGAFLADVGFGNLTPTAALSLDYEGDQPTGHEDLRLERIGDETLLQARLGTEWEHIYRFSSQPTYPVDHEVANWFTSTKPDGPLTANAIVARPAIGCRKTFFNGKVTIRDMNNRTKRSSPESPAMLHDALAEHFGITLNADELATVHAAAQRFAARPGNTFQMD